MNIIWALAETLDGATTDLRNNYPTRQELLEFSDGTDHIDAMWEFWLDLTAGMGYQWAKDRNERVCSQFPNITKFLTINVYS